jgi:hypothetical protein
MKEPFDGGFNITKLLTLKGNKLQYMITIHDARRTSCKSMKTGDKFSDITRDYNTQSIYVEDGGRSGYEQLTDTELMLSKYPILECVFTTT